VHRPEPSLFQTFPALRGVLPHHPLVTGPTPVDALALAGVPDGVLFVKHDERCSPRYGGNKPRKLEWILGAALARGTRRLITTGGLGTHHGLATTILAREAGLDTTLVLVAQPVTSEVQHTLLLLGAWGADLRWGRNVPGAAAQVVGAFARAAARGERAALVPTGGSSTRGHLGLVSAALELAQQVRDRVLPEPAEIWVPIGSGGTLAGLAAGAALAGLRARLVGVLVTDILPPSPRRIARMARASLRELHRFAPGITTGVAPRAVELVRTQLGAGYGAATAEAEAAVAAAAERGLVLETTYTGKCLAALLERARGAAGPILFWNTFNAVELERSAPRALSAAALPAALARYAAPEALV
jgi:D-cysteine desulfhydrase